MDDKPEKEVKPLKVACTVIRRLEKGRVAVLFDGELYQVSSSDIKDNMVDPSKLTRKYGVAWAENLSIDITPKDIQAALYEKGIYTAFDLQMKQQQAVNAIRELFGVSLGALNRIAKKQRG